MSKELDKMIELLTIESRSGGGVLLQELLDLAEVVADDLDNIEGDIAALKTQTPPPKGFTSWEQFDGAVTAAGHQFNQKGKS
jgi:hypothetical protein